MKFCQECGTKNEAIGGNPPKFCCECGHPFGGTVKSSVQSQVVDQPHIEEVDYGLKSLAFDFHGGHQVFKAEDLIGKGRSNLGPRQKSSQSIDEIRESLKSKQVHEID